MTRTQAIAAYAARFHGALGSGHRAASPLGAWLLLALVAPAAEGERREEIEEALGLPADEAAAFARILIEDPHPAIATALAAWTRNQGEALAPWLNGLPARVERGELLENVDAWVRKATAGQIERLPVEIDPLAVLLFVAAVAAAGKWHEPFGLLPASRLGESPWASEVENVLTATDAGHGIRMTQSAGLVGVHVRPTREAFIVTSVIAAPEVPPEKVIAAAHEVAFGVRPTFLFDLPSGEGHAWTITEREVPEAHPGSRTQSGRVFLPAWKAEAAPIDLLSDRRFGFRAVADALIALLPPNPLGWLANAAQATTATYDRHGFSAASVTSIEILEGMALPPEKTEVGLHRHVEIRFGRPYAVVAVADSPYELLRRRGAPEPAAAHLWMNVPLFSAWVTKPMEPDPAEPETSRWR
jgi:hypothetical protein